MIPARGPQTKFLYDLCCAILGVPHTSNKTSNKNGALLKHP